MTSILTAICRIYRNSFKRHYLRNKRLFLDFLLNSQIWVKFRAFSKKKWVSYPNYFRNYWCWKTWLLKRLKGLASEHHSLMNVLTGSKHCWNQHGTTITLFPRQFEVNCVAKSHLQSGMKSEDCLLNHSLPMTSIPAAICRIYSNNFKRHYVINKRLFLDFLLHFWNVH